MRQILCQELDNLTKKYKEKENDSLGLLLVEKDKYLCIRLDGFKATKSYLKDTLTNKAFSDALDSTACSIFHSFRKYFSREKESIIALYICNDEISIILNNNLTNDANRIMKVCTLFSGMASSIMTKELIKKKLIKVHSRVSIAFDARPLVLNNDEVSEYIYYRYLVSTRYAYWKVLRLKEVDGVYEDYIKKDIDMCIKLVKDKNYENQAELVLQSYSFYYINEDIKKEIVVMKIQVKSLLSK
ncbi:MAG: hypothetical protein MJK08_04005 [Campylobacterales bacterium]|nr:hypothetical protein [Campylobacterales bacterium]